MHHIHTQTTEPTMSEGTCETYFNFSAAIAIIVRLYLTRSLSIFGNEYELDNIDITRSSHLPLMAPE